MFDRNAPSSLAALAEIEKESVRKSLMQFAVWRTRHEATAEDLVGEAIELVCDPDAKPWDPAKRTFFGHMRWIINDLATARARRGYGRFEMPESETIHEQSIDPAPGADDLLHEQREAAVLSQLGEALYNAVKDSDEVACKILVLSAQGIIEPSQVARRLNRPLPDVYEANRRLKYHAAKIRASHEQRERERMKAARERARKKSQ